jgi:hypothetical protein
MHRRTAGRRLLLEGAGRVDGDVADSLRWLVCAGSWNRFVAGCGMDAPWLNLFVTAMEQRWSVDGWWPHDDKRNTRVGLNH